MEDILLVKALLSAWQNLWKRETKSMKRNRPMSILLIFVVFLSLTIFSSRSNVALAGGKVRISEVTLSGTVTKTADGVFLKTKSGIYKVTGKDLSALQGKTVNVTGTIVKSEKGMTINATKVEALGK
jgi:hypothetical protein